MAQPNVPPHFFISYTQADRVWAEWIAWELEQAGYRVVIQAWDFTPGRNWAHAMHEAASRAERVVAVLSPAYLDSAHGQVEWEVFYSKDPLGERGLLMPVRIAEVDPPGLLATRVYVDLFTLDEESARAVLLAAARGGRAKPATASRFPGVVRQATVSDVEEAPRFPGEPPAVWNVPVRNPHFTGRAEMLRELRHRLHAGEGAPVVQALYGLGGVGKTQLAIEYAHRFAVDYQLVWWIDAEQPVLIADQLTRLATRMGSPAERTVAGTVDLVLAELRRRRGWLLIFDNAERPQDIEQYQPGGSGHVLVTSRHPGWGGLGGRVEVDVLARPETVELLRRRIPELDAALADQLAAELGDLPLAAAQAAAYLEQTGLSPGRYLDRFRSRRANLLAKGDVLRYQGRVSTTWTLSMDRLQLDSPAAVPLLQAAAFYGPEPIPVELFTDHPELLHEPLRAAAADEDAFADTVGAVVGFSLARRLEDSFQLHRLVQATIRQQLTADQQQAMIDQALALLAAAHPGNATDPASWDAYARLAPHVLATSPLGDDHADSRQLMLGTIDYLNIRGDSRTSRLLAQEVLDRWRQELGPDHPDTITLATVLVFVLAWMGEGERARSLGGDTLERSRQVLGGDHPTTLASAGALILALALLGETDRARVLGQDTLERCRRVLGLDHPTTLATAAALTVALAGLGEAEQARQLGQDTLERCRRVIGPDHPTTLRAAGALILALTWLGEGEAASPLAEDTLERCRRVLGLDHPTTLATTAVVTVLLAGMGEAGPARILGDDTLERCRGVLGADHPTTLATAAALTVALAGLGEAEQARQLGQDTLERCRRVIGPDDPTTLVTAGALTVALAMLGEGEQARTLGQDTVDRCRAVLSPDHPNSVISAGALTVALALLGEAEQTRVLGEDTLERSRRVLGPDHPTTLATAAALTAALAGLGEAEEARHLGQDALERSRRVLGPDHLISSRLAQTLELLVPNRG